MAKRPNVRTKGIYEPRERADGTRILVMRFWPRGVGRERVDEWIRDLAPSRELLFAFKREGLAWKEFAFRYRAGLPPDGIEALRRRKGTFTLL